MIKAVFLDVDNTLLDFHECARTSIRQSMQDFGHDYDDALFPIFLRINVGLWQSLERGEIDLQELYRIRFQTVFDECGIGLDGPAFETRFRLHLAESSETVEGAVELAEYLGSKYPVYIASNAPHAQQVKRLTAAGIMPHVREIFTSEQMGYSKPDIRFFEGCLAKLGDIAPDEIVLIGDSLTADIAGGIAAGLKTIWFDYEGADKDSPANWTVKSLSEIKNYI